MEYTQSETGKFLLDASAIPQDDDEARAEFTGDVIHYQTTNPEVTQAIRAVKECCAIGRGAKKAEDGRQALEHSAAPQHRLHVLPYQTVPRRRAGSVHRTPRRQRRSGVQAAASGIARYKSRPRPTSPPPSLSAPFPAEPAPGAGGGGGLPAPVRMEL
jgi:hypothetical protein